MTAEENDPYHLASDIASPFDDGAAAHLVGMPLPIVKLASTHGREIDLQGLDHAVLFFYPRTGIPSEPAGPEWNAIPGARGCTPQCVGYRDLFNEFHERGIKLFGVSTQQSAYQRAFAERNRMPFEFLADDKLVLVKLLRLPTFEFAVQSGGPTTLVRRMSWYVDHGRIEKIWYPVFPPERNAGEVLAWLDQTKGRTRTSRV